jgi:8-oxo-dGTP diphosphatase
MTVLLVRHAKAGDRDRWKAPDHLRPLTTKGQGQAEGLVASLAGFAITRVLSSPYVRCTQTVEPLAAARGLEVESSEDLAEGAGEAAIVLVRRLLDDGADIVLCTHGDIVEEVLDDLGVSRSEWTKKGATWLLEPNRATSMPPPA